MVGESPGGAAGAALAPGLPTGASNVSAPFAHAIHWEGSIPYGMWSCLPQVGCDVETPGAYGSEHFEDLQVPDAFVGGNLSGGLTLTWTAESAVTAEMSVGAYLVLPGCGSCDVVDLGPDTTGSSPLTLTFAGSPSVPAGAQIHLWVYGGPYEVLGPGGEAVVGLSGAQPFVLDGQAAIAAD